MADFRYIRCSTWHDDYVLELTPPGKLLFVWAFTNEHVNQAGFMTLHPRTAAFETGLSVEEVEQLLGRFEADGKIRRDGRLVFIVNFPRHQSTSSEKLLKRISRDLEALGQTPLVEEFKRRYPQLIIPAVSSPPSAPPSSSKTGREEKGEGKTEGIDTVSAKQDTVSPPLPKNLPFELRDRVVHLRLQKKEHQGRLDRLRAQGKTHDVQGYNVRDLEQMIAQADKEIAAIIEANA